jgi:hypothetical protein
MIMIDEQQFPNQVAALNEFMPVPGVNEPYDQNQIMTAHQM